MGRMARQEMGLLRRPDRWEPWRSGAPPVGAKGWLSEVDEVWTNGTVVVLSRPVATSHGEVRHFAVRTALSNELPWVAMQHIKDTLAGPERIAVEVCPRAQDIVDEADMYHLWVLPEGARLPFGLHPGGHHGT